VHADPLNDLDIGFLRRRAGAVLSELVAALPAAYQGKVQGIPLVVDDRPGEVNAFAACTEGKALMAVTDGLLEIEAQMAKAKATDELFRTRKLEAYIQLIATEQNPGQPVVRPAAGFWDPVQHTNGNKVQRQHQIFDEELAYTLGHELAHHYLDHTGCAGPQAEGVTPADVARVLSANVPVFNQPNEIGADTNGTYNLLGAGARRQDYHWTEGGALLVLYFFDGIRRGPRVERILFGFESSHPDPVFRIPIVQQAANTWRASGGRLSPSPLPIPLPIPGFGG